MRRRQQVYLKDIKIGCKYLLHSRFKNFYTNSEYIKVAEFRVIKIEDNNIHINFDTFVKVMSASDIGLVPYDGKDCYNKYIHVTTLDYTR